MKNYNLLLFMLLLCSWSAQATILTVSNNGGTPAQYTDLQVAHNSANSGDTLFVHASGTSYGNINISKQIAIIGEGYAAASRTTVAQIEFTNSAASGSSLTGLYITGFIYANAPNVQVDAVAIERCYLYRNGNTSSANYREVAKILSRGNNWIIRHCIAYQTALCEGYAPAVGTSSGWIIANNLIDNNDNSTSYYTITMEYLNAPIIENNVFAYSDNIMDDINNAVVKNNIFIQVLDVDDNNEPSNSILNNLADNTVLGTTNGNIQNTNPLFVSSYVGSSIGNVPILNLQLQAASLARGAGVGGTDIGIHGGATPMPYPYDGKAAKPNIEQLIIQNPVVGQGQFLKFQIEAKTRD